MSDPPDTIFLYLDVWRPNPGWAQVVRPAYRVLTMPDVSWSDAVPAWVQIAMMLGDTRAAPLCVLVCLHAHHSMPGGVHEDALYSHLHLGLWDLGMAEPVEKADESGVMRHVMQLDHDALQRWVDGVLQPFEHSGPGGRLACAALFSLRLAALRTNVIAGPDKPSLAQILDPTLWTETPS